MNKIRFYPTHADAADVSAAMTENELSQAKVVILEQALSNTRLTVQDLECRLAVATGLLTKVHGLDCRFCGNLLRLGHKDDCEYADFLADPSQAIEGYRRAMQVVERVKVRLARLRDWRDGQPCGVSGLIENEMKLLEDLLLGDAAQDESPLDPSAREDAVIERLREMEEKP